MIVYSGEKDIYNLCFYEVYIIVKLYFIFILRNLDFFFEMRIEM